jgi:hypothetical protein
MGSIEAAMVSKQAQLEEIKNGYIRWVKFRF